MQGAISLTHISIDLRAINSESLGAWNFCVAWYRQAGHANS